MEAGARAELTLNIKLMSVTLDVLTLSDWLNVFALCREQRKRMQWARCGPGDGRA